MTAAARWEFADGAFDVLACCWPVQGRQEPRQSLARMVAVDRVDDLEQRLAAHAPGKPVALGRCCWR